LRASTLNSESTSSARSQRRDSRRFPVILGLGQSQCLAPAEFRAEAHPTGLLPESPARFLAEAADPEANGLIQSPFERDLTLAHHLSNGSLDIFTLSS